MCYTYESAITMQNFMASIVWIPHVPPGKLWPLGTWPHKTPGNMGGVWHQDVDFCGLGEFGSWVGDLGHRMFWHLSIMAKNWLFLFFYIESFCGIGPDILAFALHKHWAFIPSPVSWYIIDNQCYGSVNIYGVLMYYYYTVEKNYKIWQVLWYKFTIFAIFLVISANN